MKESAEEQGEDRLKSYTVQLWQADMQFLQDLAEERNESAGELRRRALRIGKLIVATETPPKNGRYGKAYTPAELAQELANSIVVQAVQFAERQGVSLVTIPVAFFDGLQRSIASGFTSAIAATGGIRLVDAKREEGAADQEEEEEKKQAQNPP